MSRQAPDQPRKSGSVALVIVVEPGFLESQAHLLVRSVRRWGGTLSDMAIHAYKPRQGGNLSSDTLALFSQLAVELHSEPINIRHAAYPMANPIYAALAAERSLSEEIIVVCDCDTVLLNPPHAFALEEGIKIAVQPVRRRSRGSTGPDDPYDPFWLDMYSTCGVEPQRYVHTMTDRIRIRGYWNAGLVVARRDAGLMSAWMKHFELLHAATLSKDGSLAALDQLALAPTVDLCADNEIRELPYHYNYVVPQRALMLDPDMRNVAIDELIHVHYHRWFNRENFLRLVEPPFDTQSEKLIWLDQHLPLLPAHEEPLHGLEPTSLTPAQIRTMHMQRSRAFKSARAEHYADTGLPKAAR